MWREWWRKFLAKVLMSRAGYLLNKFDPLVIGVTGSVGKSSTKEAIYAVLKEKYLVRRNVSNFNNEIGLPISIIGEKKPSGVLAWLKFIVVSWWKVRQIKDFPTHLIMEMGADQRGDIAYLAKMVHPMIGVITNIGDSHMEFLGSRKGIMMEKRALIESLPKNGWAVLNFDDDLVMQMKKKCRARVITYGLKSGANVSAHNIKITSAGTSFKLVYNGSVVPVLIKLIGFGAVRAALAATAVGLAVDMDILQIVRGLQNWQSLPGRMNIIKGKKGMIIVDDSYNASRDSMISGIETLKRIDSKFRKVAILGSMWELGQTTEAAHFEVGQRAARYFDIIIGVEKNASLFAKGALSAGMKKENIILFPTTDDLLEEVDQLLQPNDLVFVKGSEGKNRLEKVVYHLMLNKKKAAKLLVRQSDEWLTNK